MDKQMESLMNEISCMLPSVSRPKLEKVAQRISLRSYVSQWDLLVTLYEDLLCGVPFRHTAIGKSYWGEPL